MKRWLRHIGEVAWISGIIVVIGVAASARKLARALWALFLASLYILLIPLTLLIVLVGVLNELVRGRSPLDSWNRIREKTLAHHEEREVEEALESVQWAAKILGVSQPQDSTPEGDDDVVESVLGLSPRVLKLRASRSSRGRRV